MEDYFNLTCLKTLKLAFPQYNRNFLFETNFQLEEGRDRLLVVQRPDRAEEENRPDQQRPGSPS